MIIEFSNAKTPSKHSVMAVAIVVTACAFFFIPTTLIILGYYSTQPTGSLISPLPQGTLSSVPTPTKEDTVPSIIPAQTPDNQPIIATNNQATSAANSNVATNQGSNIADKVAVIDPKVQEMTINDPEVTDNSQIYLSPRPEDKSIYFVRSKKSGSFVIAVGDASDTVRYIDYHIVTP